MIGKVIEGRYEGASICKFPDNNLLFIETEDGERIALSKKNIVSITDVTEQYPSYGKKVMMVMWNNHEKSIYQIGYSAKPEVQMKEKTQPAKLQPVAKGDVRPQKRTSLITVLFLACVLVSLLIACCFLLKPAITKDQNETAEVQNTEQSEAVEIVAPQNIEPTETVKSETPVEFAYADDGLEESPEEDSDRVQNSRPPVIEESSKDQAYICRGMVSNTGTGVNIRVGPSMAYNSIGKVPPDTIVEILEFSDDGKWGRVESGWVYMYYISFISDKTEQEVQTPEFYGEYKYIGKIINCVTVNVRQQPSTSSPEVADLKSGAAIVIYETTIAENMAWGRCDQGWLYLYYVDLTPVGTDAIDARVVYNYNTHIYADKDKNIQVGTYHRMEVVDIYEISGKMARTDLGWIDTDNLLNE